LAAEAKRVSLAPPSASSSASSSSATDRATSCVPDTEPVILPSTRDNLPRLAGCRSLNGKGVAFLLGTLPICGPGRERQGKYRFVLSAGPLVTYTSGARQRRRTSGAGSHR